MKKVITYGTFDLLHQGHVNLLRRAKALGDWLIVGVTTDKFDQDRGKLNTCDDLMTRIEAVKNAGIVGMGGAGFDVCNGYLVLHVSTDLSQPKDEWVDLSWFVDFEGDHAVVTIPEMFLESARQSIENSTGRAASGLFLSVGIATEEVLDMNALFLLSQPNEN